jgi:KUP system potassium uptake protein
VSSDSHVGSHDGASRGSGAALALGALGVVFGDLGTSPLYTLPECLAGSRGVPPDRGNVLGILSLVFWSLIMVVSVKYLVFLLRADNRREGGIMALLALTPRRFRESTPGRPTLVILLVIAGAALLFGDGIITPAISVLSAVEGLQVATKALEPAVVPLTVVILGVLFAVQRRGTGGLGRFFGPVMLVWFVAIAALGAYHVARRPDVLWALSPHPGIAFFARHGVHGIRLLGGVVLAVTGAEALYADLGHFGRVPIQRAWSFVCLPSLVLNYFGQGAVLLVDPSVASRSFYAMCPSGAGLYPFVALATVATIIASQALISGVFSLGHQAMRLGLFPRLRVLHTSGEAEGQIYLPALNWGLGLACVTLVLLFRESAALAAAYGLAVSGTMAITSIVYFVVIRHAWRWPAWQAWPVLLVFLSFDIAFAIGNSLKFFDGGYLPVLIGAAFASVMVLWRKGRGLLAQLFAGQSVDIAEFLREMTSIGVARIPGTGVFMTSNPGAMPPALIRVLRHFRVVHETVLLLTIVTKHIPTVAAEERAEVEALGQGFYRVVLYFGFMDRPLVSEAMAQVFARLGADPAPDRVAYVLGHETFVAGPTGQMGRFAESVFGFLSRNASNATSYFGIPAAQVMEIGAQIDL